MLKVAIPNKGSLSDSAVAMLKEAGYRQRTDPRDLTLIDNENEIEFYYLRPRDIALYVASGELEVGITGRDLLIDSGAEAVELLALDFGKSTFRFAAPLGSSLKEADLAGKRVATAYPGLVANHFEKSGLTVFGEPILQSEAILIERQTATRSTEVETILRRLQGVVIARQYVLVDYDVRSEFLDAACALTPGIESPTISPLQRSDWNAVRAMVKRSDINRIMDDLWKVGARGILVTDIHACRL